ncbi:MAG: flagellar motor switch protein FliM [Bryobacterales bacterium]|nr:flagellar motor switch protein FliM [Bryobacterales bacterium]
MNRLLSQDEIDKVFRRSRDPNHEDRAKKAVQYDFRRPDRIAKDQLRAIHLLHDNFARNLASSLSAYLRAYVAVNLVSVEQLSFSEFIQCLPSPTCMVSLGMRPFDGNAVLELNPSLVFPLLEMLLGGSGKAATRINRETTEIEQSILDALFRIILNDLKTAWQGVSNIAFVIEGRETEPQLLQILAPNEAIVSIGLEIRVGENSGMMNIGMPSIIVKMLRHRFDQQWSMRRTDASEEHQQQMLRLLKPTTVHLDARLAGPTMDVADMLELKTGDVLSFDFPVGQPIRLTANGTLKYEGQVVAQGRRRAFFVERLVTDP